MRREARRYVGTVSQPRSWGRVRELGEAGLIAGGKELMVGGEELNGKESKITRASSKSVGSWCWEEVVKDKRGGAGGERVEGSMCTILLLLREEWM